MTALIISHNIITIFTFEGKVDILNKIDSTNQMIDPISLFLKFLFIYLLLLFFFFQKKSFTCWVL